MTEKKIDPTKYAGLTQEEKVRRMAEDERRAINESPAVVAAVRDLERRETERQAEQQQAVVSREKLREKKFSEDFDARYRDRLEFYRLKGVPQSVFDAEIWPNLARQFVLGEEDPVDQARRERAADIY